MKPQIILDKCWRWIKSLLKMKQERKYCCNQEENLGPIIQERPDLIYRRCKICNCRHFELSLDPGKIGITGNNLSC
jgi:hypothetical protein